MKKIFISLLAFSLVSCAQKGADAARSDEAPKLKQEFKIDILAQDLEFPWGLAFLPNGDALVTEKPGRLRIFQNGKLSNPINGLPNDIFYDGQGGLLDIAVHPDFAQNNLVFLSYSKGTKEQNATTLLRAKLINNNLEEVKEIYNVDFKKKGGSHFGGRILFLSDKSILLSIGEGFNYKDEAQNKNNDLGKIIHLDENGKKPKHIFSYGHRNPQGLALDSENNIIYEIEHGPRGGDEINILEFGKNYGWPKITYGIDYSGLPISDKVAMDGMEQPLIYWVPSIAPSAATFYNKDLFKNFKGDLLVSAMAGQQLRHIDLENGKVVKEEVFLTEMETRFRNIITAPDGSLWVLTDAPEGKILRLSPKN